MGYWEGKKMHFSEWDNQLFDVFNRQLSFNGLDTFALFISDYRNWWVLSFGILTLGLVFKKKNWLKALLMCSVALGATDAINTHLLKKRFQRLRPCHQREVVLRAGSCGSQFGMPSNHAANGASVVTAASFCLKGGALGIVAALAFLVGWSRVYLGVHFPFDVLVGWIVGGMIGTIVARILLKLGTYLKSFR
jgi:undecaprenyl-diphosphatase